MTFESVVQRPRQRAQDAGPFAYLSEVLALSEQLGTPLGNPAAPVDRATRSQARSKRALDICFGTVLALATLPIIGVLAVGVAISLREWPFFVQRRVGLNGRHFLFPKLRTLPRGTPPYASKYDLDVELGRFTAFLRRSHLDELPQLLAVPLGWMSLVGPRPEMPQEYMETPTWYAEARTQVPQGCTGLWQISRHTHRLLHEVPEFDLFYIEHASLRLDLWILWRTFCQFVGISQPLELTDIVERADRIRARKPVAEPLTLSS